MLNAEMMEKKLKNAHSKKFVSKSISQIGSYKRTKPENDLGVDESKNSGKSDHFETYVMIHNINYFFGWVVGLGVSKTWTYNNATRWTKFMLIFGTASAVYSSLLVITKPSKLIEVFSLFGVIIPAFLKFELFLKNYKNALALNEFLLEVFKANSEGLKADLLKTHIDGNLVSVKIFIPLQSLALAVFTCYPVYGYIANNEFIQIMPMQFPCIDQSSTNGFIIGNLIMLKMGIWAYFGSVGFDLFIARFIYNYSALVKLLQQDLIDYAEMCKKTANHSHNYRKMFLRNFLLKCQDKDRFIQVINNTYAGVIFQQFSIVYISLIFTIYAIIRNHWYSGFGMVIFCLSQLYILCFLGTKISSENDKFCATIYDMPWYDYPISIQKEIQLLLHSSQNAMELWIGPLAPLNVKTGYEISKSIYSTSTMIINTSY